MEDSVPEIIDRTLRLGRTSPESTERFRSVKHDKNLLWAFQRQFERLLNSYGKLSPITYDTQGPWDHGVDIAIRRHNEKDEFDSLIGFQIKTTDDLLEPGYLMKLKAQQCESSLIKGLQQYYIVICVHEEAHKNRLRAIEAAFKNMPRTKIIEPSFADYFLSLSQERIDAYIHRTLAGGDVVLKKALETVDFNSRMTGAVLVFLTVSFYIERGGPVDLTTLMASDTLKGVHNRLMSKSIYYDDDMRLLDESAEVTFDFESQIQHDLEILGEGFIVFDGQSITVQFEQVVSLVAIATDALVRYEYPPQSVTPYLLDLLNLSE